MRKQSELALGWRVQMTFPPVHTSGAYTMLVPMPKWLLNTYNITPMSNYKYGYVLY